MIKIAFICYGNSCRSQMGEGWAKHISKGEWEVYSAGLVPLGQVTYEAIVAMEKHGIDISNQYSKGFDEIPMDELDYIVSMGVGNIRNKRIKAKEIIWDTEDPYQMGQEKFDEICLVIRDQIQDLYESI